MAHFILLLIAAAVVGVVGFGVTWLVAGRDQGLAPEEPDGRAVPLPTTRPLLERDVNRLRFDTTLRGYRMGQVDAALRRAAYDIGYKQELINVLEAENVALRDGRMADADILRAARIGAVAPEIDDARAETDKSDKSDTKGNEAAAAESTSASDLSETLSDSNDASASAGRSK